MSLQKTDAHRCRQEEEDIVGYVALYRRWRPQDFEALVGQEHIRTALTNALTLGKIAHAYLFTGPRGTGKTSTARILAKALNCEQGPTAHPCNTCENCRQITSGSSMDVVEIDAASNRGIDEIRQLREKVAFAPVNGRYKVYIIDEIHMLTTDAFNALLKTLEEPPAHVVFILATTEPHKIPATIHSRCQRFDFHRVTTEAIAQHLRLVATGSEITVEDEALTLMAIQADGGLRDALSLLDQCAVMATHVTAESVRLVLGIVGREGLRELVGCIGRRDLSGTLQKMNELTAQGKDVRQILVEVADYLRAVLLYLSVPNYSEIFLTDTASAIQSMAPLFSSERIMAAEQRVHEALDELRWTVRGKLTAELCLFDLCKIQGDTLAALTARVEQLEQQLAGKELTVAASPPAVHSAPVTGGQSVVTPVLQVVPPVKTQAPVKAKIKTSAPVVSPSEVVAVAPAEPLLVAGDLEAGIELWQQTLKRLKANKKAALCACAAGGVVVDLANQMLTVGFKNQFNCDRINSDDYRTMVESVLAELSGQTLRLRSVVTTASVKAKPSKTAPTKVTATQAQPLASSSPAELDPSVQKALSIFGGAVEKL
ncbi:MAG: DNA polymerase III subunit gamma/tau [Acidaminococcaceae bacterium]